MKQLTLKEFDSMDEAVKFVNENKIDKSDILNIVAETYSSCLGVVGSKIKLLYWEIIWY